MSATTQLTAKTPEETKIFSSQKFSSGYSGKSIHRKIHDLHRTIGNRGVEQLHPFGILQAKLKISRPGDLHEQEADRIADNVMRMPEPRIQRQTNVPGEDENISRQTDEDKKDESINRQVYEDKEDENISRQTDKPEEDESINRQVDEDKEDESINRQADEDKEEKETAQAKGFPGKPPVVTPDMETRINTLKGGGKPLSVPERAFFEPRFGMDFSTVRIHTDSRAAGLAREINAKAFTIGRNVVFGAGQYRPEMGAGKRLMAHELGHVVQQGGGGKIQTQRYRGVITRVNPAKGVKRMIISPAPPVIQTADFDFLGAGKRFFGRGKRFLKSTIKKGVKFIKQGFGSILKRITPKFREIPGYNLARLVIGVDPVTRKKVPRTPASFVRAFVPGDLYKKLNQTKSVAAAFRWLSLRVKRLKLSVPIIWNLIKKAGRFFVDHPLKVFKPFADLKRIFGPVLSRIWRFIRAIGGKIKELILRGALSLAGGQGKKVLGILNKGKAVFGKILNNPVLFIKNFLSAVKLGFLKFKSNFVKHFKAAIFGWLFGTLSKAGITMPEKFDLKGVFFLIAQILNLTYESIRMKLVKRLGPNGEAIVSTIEKTVTFVKDLMTRGPIVLWEKVKESVGNLKDIVIDGIKGWMVKTIVGKAMLKIISMLNSAGALIQVALAIYNTIMFFIERWDQIKSLVSSVFNSVRDIAFGKLKGVAYFIEQSMAKALPVIISFLARLIGLGGISEKIRGVIGKIRKPIDRAVDKVIGWIVKMGRKVFKKVKGFGKRVAGKIVQWWKVRKRFRNKSGESHTLFFKGKGKNAKLMVASDETAQRKFTI